MEIAEAYEEEVENLSVIDTSEEDKGKQYTEYLAQQRVRGVEEIQNFLATYYPGDVYTCEQTTSEGKYKCEYIVYDYEQVYQQYKFGS